jgi:FkbH-like protein
MPIETIAELRDALPGFTFNDYLRHVKFAEDRSETATPLRVAVLRSYTVEPIEPVLKVHLMLDGYRPSFWFGGYDQYVQEILDPAGGLHEFRPGLVLLMVRLEELVPGFVEQFPSKTAAEWSDRLAAKARELAALAGRAATDLSAQVIVQNVSLSRPYFGIHDAQRHDGQHDSVQGFNRTLAEAAEALQGVFVWDFDGLVRIRGFENLYDAKSWYVSRNPFKQSAYPAIAKDVFRYVRSAAGRVKKCVVVDLDNTLWGGIAGEDGLEGIRLGHTYPGNCYRDFQHELLKLYHRGILLAINSKNNEADALSIIDEHPDMVLRRSHFAAMRINWDDKATNLRALAQELNIGLDSMIFVDDNPAECDFVRREIPECDVVLLPDKPYLLPAIVEALPGIENIRLTTEDRQKGEMYRVRAAQREQESSYSNIEEFLDSLDLEVAIEAATAFSVPRVAQLTQKTNQMNMTTRRYSEAHIAAFVGDPRYGVYSVAAKDRFGDHGIIGVLILEFADDACRIDTFLLSCRVIGRGIERLMVAFAAETAQRRDRRVLIGEFLPTPKNAPAAGFYQAAGFRTVGPTEYRAELLDTPFPRPPHIRVVAADLGGASAPA